VHTGRMDTVTLKLLDELHTLPVDKASTEHSLHTGRNLHHLTINIRVVGEDMNDRLTEALANAEGDCPGLS